MQIGQLDVTTELLYLVTQLTYGGSRSFYCTEIKAVGPLRQGLSLGSGTMIIIIISYELCSSLSGICIFRSAIASTSKYPLRLN